MLASLSLKPRRAAAFLTGMADALVSVLFPADCRLCGRLLTTASRTPICGECLGSFAVLRGMLCDRCGLAGSEWSLGDDQGQPRAPTSTCPICREREYGFERARSYASYRGRLVRAIVLLKFERIEPLGKWFGERLREVVQQHGLEGDLVVPVPLHRQREKERGYNQADLIAKPLARSLRLPYKSLLLVRTKPRPDKHILSLEERWDAVRGAFATRPGAQVDNLRVLLVDDVMTTGATLDACAKALRGAGAKSVIGLTVARAGRNPV
jgi:competence protein ComFC